MTNATKPRFIIRVVGAALAVASIALLAWSLVLVSVEYRYRRLPVLTEDDIDTEDLARLGIELGRLLRLDPHNGEVRNAYASVLGRQRENEKAVAQLEVAHKIQNAQNSLFFLADMYERLGRHDQALATMSDCVVINPSNPQYNEAWIRLLFNRMVAVQNAFDSGKLKDRDLYYSARRQYAMAARDWFVRAPHDFNSYLFMANYHVSQIKVSPPQFYLIQAYRLLLLGLSGSPWMDLSRTYMVQPQKARETLNQILINRYAKPYKGLP